MNVHREVIRLRTLCTVTLPVFILTLNILAVIGYIFLWAGSGGDKRPMLKIAVSVYISAAVLAAAEIAGSMILPGMVSDITETGLYRAAAVLCAGCAILAGIIASKLGSVIKQIPDDRKFFD